MFRKLKKLRKKGNAIDLTHIGCGKLTLEVKKLIIYISKVLMFTHAPIFFFPLQGLISPNILHAVFMHYDPKSPKDTYELIVSLRFWNLHT